MQYVIHTRAEREGRVGSDLTPGPWFQVWQCPAMPPLPVYPHAMHLTRKAPLEPALPQEGALSAQLAKQPVLCVGCRFWSLSGDMWVLHSGSRINSGTLRCGSVRYHLASLPAPRGEP